MNGHCKIFWQAGRLLLAVICAHVAAGAMARAEIPFFLSPTGNDFTGNGSITNPWQTVVKARNYIRTSGLNSNQSDEIVIYLRGGRYEQSQTLAFTPADSGTNGFYITYRSYPGEAATISGGKRVTGWTQIPGKPYWVASVATASGFASYFRQLYVNDIRAERAHSEWIQGVGYCNDPATSQAVDGIAFSPGSLPNYSNVTDMRLLHTESFKVDEFPINSIVTNVTNGNIEVRLQQPYCQTRYDYNNGTGLNFFSPSNRWMFVSAFEELDEPGEWYLNRVTQQVYYYPYSFEDMNTALVYAPVVQTLVSLTGTSPAAKVRNLRFQNLIFEHGNWLFPRDYFIGGSQAEILFNGAPPNGSVAYSYEVPGQLILNQTAGIQFLGNTFRHLGSCGVHPYNGARDTLIQGNCFYDLTAAAVMGGRWGGTAIANEEICTNTIVADNVIRNTGSDFMASTLVDNLRHYGFQTLRNDLADGQYAGFHQRNSIGDVPSSVGWGGTIVSSNRITMGNNGGRYGIGDIGFIYTFGVWPNSRIEANDMYDVYTEGGDVHGIYLDNATYGFAVVSNVMRKVDPGIWGYKLIRALTNTSNIAIGNYGDSTVNTFAAVATNTGYVTFPFNSPPAAAQTIMAAAGVGSGYTNLLSNIYGGVNLAQGKAAWASSQASNSTPPSSAVDWNFNTMWQSAAGDSNCWWAVDLGAAYVVQRLELGPRIDLDDSESRRDFQVQGANDANFTNFTVLSEQNSVPFPFRLAGQENSWVKYLNNPNAFRYLRVRKTTGGRLNISEFRAYGYLSDTNPLSLTWDASATGAQTDGSGEWLATDQWWNGALNQAWANGNNAVIGNSNGAAGTITITGGSPQLSSLTFNPATSGSYTLTGNPVTLTGMAFANVTANADAELACGMVGLIEVEKQGSATLTLSASNNFTAVNIYGGVLNLADSNAPGNASFMRPIGGSVSSAIALSGGLTFAAVPVQIQGKAGLAYGAAFVNSSGTNSWPVSPSLNSGGTYYGLRSDAGKLILPGLGPIGTLTGTRTVTLDGAGDGEFTSVIPNGQAATIALQKYGTGTWILSGNNTYTGTTTISNGVLIVNGSIASGSVIVAGGTLGGNGTNTGSVTVQSGGTLSAGTGVGRLTIAGNLTLQGTTLMEIARNGTALTNDAVTGINTNTLGGTLMVINAGSSALQVGDTFKLFAATSYTGAFTTIIYPSGYTFTNRIAVNGSIQVLAVPVTIPTRPTNLVWNVSGGVLTLSWPSNYLGWSLQVQTNALSGGLSTNWITVPGSETVTSTNLPMIATNATVFYRLKYQP